MELLDVLHLLGEEVEEGLSVIHLDECIDQLIPYQPWKGNSRYGPLHLWSMSLMGHQVVVMVQCNYGPGHLWATT